MQNTPAKNSESVTDLKPEVEVTKPINFQETNKTVKKQTSITKVSKHLATEKKEEKSKIIKEYYFLEQFIDSSIFTRDSIVLTLEKPEFKKPKYVLHNNYQFSFINIKKNKDNIFIEDEIISGRIRMQTYGIVKNNATRNNKSEKFIIFILQNKVSLKYKFKQDGNYILFIKQNGLDSAKAKKDNLHNLNSIPAQNRKLSRNISNVNKPEKQEELLEQDIKGTKTVHPENTENENGQIETILEKLSMIKLSKNCEILVFT